MNIAAIIIGIDGWEKYTKPLVESIHKHEPKCDIVVIDNASTTPYPNTGYCYRTERMCYSAAINTGKRMADERYCGHHDIEYTKAMYESGSMVDWYIVLSNDVLCTGPFAHLLAAYGDGDLVGPLMKVEYGFHYLEGWCVCVPARAWQPWDERFLGSDYEDVAYSTAARQRGFGLVEDTALPFVHLDQRQRYSIVPDFGGKNRHNRELFLREYAAVTA